MDSCLRLVQHRCWGSVAEGLALPLLGTGVRCVEMGIVDWGEIHRCRKVFLVDSGI